MDRFSGRRQSQSFFRAVPYTFHAKDTLCTVLSTTGVIRNIHIHRADLPAFAAGDAFLPVASYSQKRVVAHRLKKNSDRTYVFAECTVVSEQMRQDDTDGIVEYVTYYKSPEYDVFQILCTGKEKT